MKVLAIETSTSRGHLAVVAGDGPVAAEEDFVSERGHNATIFDPLGRVLEAAGDELDWIVVGTGPGSYSGVRVGIAVADGLGLSCGAPVIGLTSLLAPGDFAGANYWVAGDARRKTFFLWDVAGGEVADEPELLDEAGFGERVRELGEAGEKVLTFDERPLPAGGDVEIVKDAPSAVRLARRVLEMGAAERAALREKVLQPIYLRAPYITEPKEGGK